MSRLLADIHNDGEKDLVFANFALSPPDGGRLNLWRND
jgi:hypothetical protein